jgi:hypothetical protein
MDSPERVFFIGVRSGEVFCVPYGSRSIHSLRKDRGKEEQSPWGINPILNDDTRYERRRRGFEVKVGKKGFLAFR